MPDVPLAIWGIPVVVSDALPDHTIRLAVGDSGSALERLAQEAVARAREPHVFKPCDLDGWCAGLCHHGACLKTEAEHDA